MKAYTSRARFDETRNFTGVYQQMGRVSVDADWNEEVQIRATDARRRTSDLAHGSPDDGFSISDEHVVDRITSAAGWIGSGLEAGDLRVIPPELRLDRREPEGLPFVVRSHGHVSVERRFEVPRDLTTIALPPNGSFAAAELVFSVRFDRPPNDDDPTDVAFFVVDADGNRARFVAFGEQLPQAWATQRLARALFAGVDWTRITAWGVSGLPPRATTWIDALRATDATLAPFGADFVVRGGDGSLAGAGRMLIDGVRAYLPRDIRYTRQPDLADPPALGELTSDGSDAHVVYLDTWEELVTALDDAFLHEPALDGLDTTVRLRLLTQIKVLQGRDAGAAIVLPEATGGGRLTTNVPAGSLPDRYPTEPVDPCRDRCLFSESASIGQGYTGAHNVHLRVEILATGGARPVFGWSRDNGSTRLPLLADAPADATSLAVSSEDAQRLRAGDVIVISDRRIDRHPDGLRRSVLRVVRSSHPESGTVMLREAGFALASDPAALVAGGPLGESFAVSDRAYVRRWDGADWLLEGVRYNLPDGITLRFTGTDQRPGEYWSFTARIENADGAARGVIEQLTNAPVHGPVHHSVPLARITRDGDALRFEDLRPRFLPLGAVRDRLLELATERAPTGAFTLIVGDGVRTFGDIDQDLIEGVTGDEALQSAVNTLRGAGGGTLYIRAGDYRLEKPVLLSACSRLRVLGDGDASALRVVGAGGAFLVDACGDEGEVGIEMLSLVEAPLEDSVIGADAEALPEPGEEVEPLEPEDLLRAAPALPIFAETVASSMLAPARLARRALNAVRATLEALRRLQRANPGQPVEDLPAAAPLLAALRSLPHGVVTVGDSRRITLHRLHIESREPQPEAGGVFVTGTCSEIKVTECRIHAASGIVAAPYAPYLSRAFLAQNTRSGLHVHNLVLRGNTLRPRGSGVHGIHVSDGVLQHIDIRDNDIDGFAIGITLRHRLDANVEASRIAVADNRVTAFTGLGIDVVGRGVDIADTTLVSGVPGGLVQIGIRARGSDIKVRDCSVALPELGAAGSPLRLIAAIVVGGGIDDGSTASYRSFAATHDVEIAGCRIRGGGAAYPGIGVLIGGPEPVLDVRVRDCDCGDLGDAAVRTWGHGGKVGRVRVDDNRIQNVALADVPGRADARSALAELAAALTETLAAAGVDLTDPRALLAALISSASAAAIAPLDLVLRWVALRTLRGAVVFDQVFEGEISSNRIDSVGRDGATQGADVYTAGVAVVGSLDLSVEHNRIEAVVAEALLLGESNGGGAAVRPIGFVTLEELELADDERRVDRADVHLALTALRRMVLRYGAGDDGERQRLGRGVYAAMDAVVTDLDSFGGAGAKIAAALALEADEMRTAQGRDDHTRASNRVRASLSRAAAFTAHGDLTQEAWDAAAQFDLAVVAGDVGATASRLQDAAGELAEGLPERRQAIEAAMAAVLGSPQHLPTLLLAAGELAILGEWRDAADRRGGKQTPTDLLGAKRTVVSRFAERLSAEAERLSIDADAQNRATLDALNPDKQALLDALRGHNDDLARAVELDWRSVERSVTESRKGRLQNTLAQVEAWAEGTGISEPEPVSADDTDRLADAGSVALTALVAKHLDSTVARLSVEPEGTKTKGLRILQTATGQLRSLVDGDPEAVELAAKATAAIGAATEDSQARASQLATARTFLDAIRRRAQILVPPPREPIRPPRPVPGVERHVAALGAAALSLQTLTGTELVSSVALYRSHFARALDAARVDGAVRATALQAVNAALDMLARSPAGSARSRSVHLLLRELDRVLATLPHTARTAGLDSAVVLIRAAVLGTSPDDDAATRLLRVQAYLRERSSALSQSVHQGLARRSDVEELLAGIRAVLERLARGERPFVPELAPPLFNRRFAPADGIFAAGPAGRLRIAGNQIQHAVRGLTVAGDDGHPLVGAQRAAAGAVVQIATNRIDGCALGGLDLRPAGDVALAMTDNEIFACSGVGEASPGDIGQAVALVRGRGQLVVSGNSLHGNGHDHPRALVHELVVDWRGEAVVRGNTLRHAGGGGGGTGLMIIAESAVSDLPRRLASAPFLGIEPPPGRPRDLPGGELGPLATHALPFVTQLAGAVTSVSGARREQLATGRLVQTTSSARIAPRLLTQPAPPRPKGLATVTATRYLDRSAVTPLRTVLDFVRPWPYWKPLPLPPPAEQRTFHIEGNDIAARGPALLLVADEAGDLISSSVVGNGLHSEGGTGAVYVRFAESLVFTGNRCQAPDAINVVVIRALASAVSVTGNVVVGREPTAPPKPPPKPVFPRPGQVSSTSLSLSLGNGAAISVPVDPVKLRGSLEAFSAEAQQAFANVLLERAAAEEPFLPPLELREVDTQAVRAEASATTAGAATTSATTTSAAPVTRVTTRFSALGSLATERLAADRLVTARSFGSILDLGAARFAISPFTEPQAGDAVLRYVEENKLGSREVDALLRGTDLRTFESEDSRRAFVDKIDLYRKTKKLEEVAAKRTVDGAVERADATRVFQRVATQPDTHAGALVEMTRLFTSQGFDAARTSAEVHALLDQSEGDAVRALGKLRTDVLASDAASLPARKVLDNASLLEKILVDGLIRGGEAIADPDPPELRPLPEASKPDPYEHSLVILGGAAVAAVGNATSAGTLVVDAGEAVELNL